MKCMKSLEKNFPHWARELERKYSLSGSCLQLFGDNSESVIIEYEAVLNCRPTLEGFREICEGIATHVGGELYGAVNVDFFGSSYSFVMMIELAAKKRGRPKKVDL